LRGGERAVGNNGKENTEGNRDVQVLDEAMSVNRVR
jgi:hypothetical protein